MCACAAAGATGGDFAPDTGRTDAGGGGCAAAPHRGSRLPVAATR